MNIIKTRFPEVLILEPEVFSDKRGFFYESFNQQHVNDAVGQSIEFVQDNQSLSYRGVLRGIHYQLAPYAQGKLIRCIAGEIFDIAVDLRRQSPTFGQWEGVYLNSQNRRQLWIPEGFGHAFLTLSEQAEVIYKTTAYYAPKFERCIVWNDQAINIQWPIPLKTTLLLSDKDKQGYSLQTAEVYN